VFAKAQRKTKENKKKSYRIVYKIIFVIYRVFTGFPTMK